jgi:hypothetical protein
MAAIRIRRHELHLRNFVTNLGLGWSFLVVLQPQHGKASDMIRKTIVIAVGLCCLSVTSSPLLAENWKEGMQSGNPDFKSMGSLAFGPEGILFVADTKNAAVTAVATGDTTPAKAASPIKVEKINQKIAALLGTTADQILINDLVVNPISRNVYLAVSRGRGPDAAPVLVRADSNGKLAVVDLDSVSYSKGELPDAPVDGVVGEGRRASNPRQESITDIAFLEDRVLIAGLSNEEFASTLRAIPFPFKTVPDGTSVEIYHGAHGRFETRSPVRTFVPFNVGDQPSLLAAYTCTPLVQFPIDELKPGAKIRGKTIAELGNRNRPLDMIVYQKDGKDYILMANSSRGIMKISTDGIEQANGITDRVEGDGVAGQSYETISGWTGVDQLDRLDSEYALVLRQNGDDSMDLEARLLP